MAELTRQWIPRESQPLADQTYLSLIEKTGSADLADYMIQWMFTNTDPAFRKERLKRTLEHPRDSRIVFDEAPHKYYVDGEDIYTSVTTFNHQMFPHFDAERVVGLVVRKASRDPSHEHHGKTRDQILEAWEANRDSASKLGTIMHQQIEWYYNGYDTILTQPSASLSRELTYFIRFLNAYPHLRAYRTEWNVFDKDLRLSGSIDMVFFNTKTNTYNIYDWKRSKEIEFDYKPEHRRFREYGLYPCVARLMNKNYFLYSLQLNVYKYILEKHYGLSITDLALVVLHPNYPDFQVIPVQDWSATVMPEVIAFREEMVRQALGGKHPLPISKEQRQRLLDDPALPCTSIPIAWRGEAEGEEGAEEDNEGETALEVEVPVSKRQKSVMTEEARKTISYECTSFN